MTTPPPLALGQGTQSTEITASEQNGTSQPLRAVLGTKAQPKDGPFFFVQRREIARHRSKAFFPQERLIPGQEDASRKAGQLRKQRFEAEAHRVVPARQAVKDGFHTRLTSEFSHFRRAGHHHPGPRGRASLLRPAPGR